MVRHSSSVATRLVNENGNGPVPGNRAPVARTIARLTPAVARSQYRRRDPGPPRPGTPWRGRPRPAGEQGGQNPEGHRRRPAAPLQHDESHEPGRLAGEERPLAHGDRDESGQGEIPRSNGPGPEVRADHPVERPGGDAGGGHDGDLQAKDAGQRGEQDAVAEREVAPVPPGVPKHQPVGPELQDPVDLSRRIRPRPAQQEDHGREHQGESRRSGGGSLSSPPLRAPSRGDGGGSCKGHNVKRRCSQVLYPCTRRNVSLRRRPPVTLARVMCGRYTSTTSATDLARIFEVEEVRTKPLPPRYNVAPSLDVFAVALRRPKNREISGERSPPGPGNLSLGAGPVVGQGRQSRATGPSTPGPNRSLTKPAFPPAAIARRRRLPPRRRLLRVAATLRP